MISDKIKESIHYFLMTLKMYMHCIPCYKLTLFNRHNLILIIPIQILFETNTQHTHTLVLIQGTSVS